MADIDVMTDAKKRDWILQAFDISLDGQAIDSEIGNAYDPTDEEISAGTKSLAEYILSASQALGFESEIQDKALQEALEEPLQNVPPERVMLALCQYQDIEDILEATELMPSGPIEPDGGGIAEVVEALQAMCANVARWRGILDEGEMIDCRNIEALLRNRWQGPPYAPASQVLPKILEWFAKTFVAADDGQLRGFLGLPAAAPSLSPDVALLDASAEEPGRDVSAAAIHDAAARWSVACEEINQHLNILKKHVDAWIKREDMGPSVEFQGGSWTEIEQAINAVMKPPLGKAIDAIESAADEKRGQAVAAVRALIRTKLAQVETNQVLPRFEGFPLLSGAKSFQSIFRDALTGMDALMA